MKTETEMNGKSAWNVTPKTFDVNILRFFAPPDYAPEFISKNLVKNKRDMRPGRERATEDIDTAIVFYNTVLKFTATLDVWGHFIRK